MGGLGSKLAAPFTSVVDNMYMFVDRLFKSEVGESAEDRKSESSKSAESTQSVKSEEEVATDNIFSILSSKLFGTAGLQKKGSEESESKSNIDRESIDGQQPI